MTPEIPYAANTERLSWRQWMVTALLLFTVFFILPYTWSCLEPFSPDDDYRLPYTLNNDYWMYRVWSRHAAKNADILLIGDSVIWGQYVQRNETLSGWLNRLQAGPPRFRFVNLSVDGLHPAAMAGLLKYYAGGVAHSKVILAFNFLWMISKEQDLRGKNEARIHHPQLIPQFLPWIASYKAPIEDRLGNVIKRYVPLFCLTSHLRTTYFDSLDLQNWTMQHPYRCPLDAIHFQIPEPEQQSQTKKAIPWIKKGGGKQNYPWVEVEESFQWASFWKALTTLRERDNDVFIIATPFNTHMLTETSREAYQKVRDHVTAALKQYGVPYHVFMDLASEEYGDASHPLARGYEKMARTLLADPAFQEWLRKDAP